MSMPEITRSPEEVRLDYLTGLVEAMGRRLNSAEDVAKKAAEDNRRPPVYFGPDCRWAQVTTVVPAMSAGVIGTTGAALLCKLIGTTFYRAYPHITIPGSGNHLVNGTGGSVAVNTLILVKIIDGQWTIISADCGGGVTSALADEPH